MELHKEFNAEDLVEFEPDAKIGLLSTISPEGAPHITLITALQAKSTTQLMFGQFSEGFSKKYVKTNPSTAFLIMNLNKEFWRGKAQWKYEANTGEDYEMFNNKPMFRYNAYFGIHTVHYLDLIGTTQRQTLPMTSIIMAALKTKFVKGAAATHEKEEILKPFAMQLFNNLGNLKFLSFIQEDGYPMIIPLIQCQASDTRRLSFAISAFSDEIKQIPANQEVAVFALSLDMEDILIRGKFNGLKKYRGITLGTVDIHWVYNSMPPKQMVIYPRPELKPIREFY